MKVRGSEQVNKNVEREKETRTSHKSATVGITCEAEGFISQPTHNLLYHYYSRELLEILGFITTQLKIF